MSNTHARQRSGERKRMTVFLARAGPRPAHIVLLHACVVRRVIEEALLLSTVVLNDRQYMMLNAN